MNQNNAIAQNGQITTNTGEIILYQPDNSIRLEVRMEEETVWLTQAQMAMLFGTQRAAITKHLNNIYQSGEIDMETTCSKMEHVGQNGSRLYTTKYYNLDAILSVGYRVNSKNATTFRRWATHVLKEYLLRGFSINQRVQIMEERIDRQLHRRFGAADAIETIGGCDGRDCHAASIGNACPRPRTAQPSVSAHNHQGMRPFPRPIPHH